MERTMIRLTQKQWHELNGKYKPDVHSDERICFDRYREWRYVKGKKAIFSVIEIMGSKNENWEWLFFGDDKIVIDA
jgi:hypothetical protein